MDVVNTSAGQALETLDRGVLLFSLGGIIYNCLLISPAGVLLTLAATLLYALVRNRIANLDHFDTDTPLPAPPGINVRRFLLICQWLGSRHLFDGLLGDLVDPEFGSTHAAARRHLRRTLWPAIGQRAWRTALARLWLDRNT